MAAVVSDHVGTIEDIIGLTVMLILIFGYLNMDECSYRGDGGP